MNVDQLKIYIAESVGFDESDLNEFNVFISVNVKPFGDASDDTLCAFMRHTNDDEPDRWFYKAFILSNVDSASLIYWDIELVYTDMGEIWNNKRQLTNRYA